MQSSFLSPSAKRFFDRRPFSPKIGLIIVLGGSVNLFLALSAPWERGWDAFTHMFFADHFAKNWFALSDSRWYGGFDVASYPPLAHQLVALLGNGNASLGFGVATWLFATLFPLALFAFTKPLLGERVAIWTALAGVFAPSVFYHTYAVGQLPTVVASVFALLGAAAWGRFVREGTAGMAVLAALWASLTIQAHHISGLFLPALFVAASTSQIRYRMKWFALSLVLFAGITLVVLFPTVAFFVGQQPQAEIYHPSRYSLVDHARLFIFDFSVALVGVGGFFLMPWRQAILLAVPMFVLALLGFGLSTPLPQLVFGDWSRWLVYDRFMMWAGFLVLPALGILLSHLSGQARAAVITIVLGLAFASTYEANVFRFYSVQPGPIEIAPVADFLKSADNSRWNYITLGFGAQSAKISMLVPESQTIDGQYHTARWQSWFRSSGAGSIDDAKYYGEKGIGLLGYVLDNGDELHLKYVFSADPSYDSILSSNGFVELRKLENPGVAIWVKDGVAPRDAVGTSSSTYLPFSLGPLIILSAAAVSQLRLRYQGQRARES